MSRDARDLVARGLLMSRATIALLVAAMAATLAPGALQLMPLDRTAALADQPWRLLTAHLVHSDAEHLAWNLLGLGILGAAFEPLLRWRLSAVLLAGALAIDAWFYLADAAPVRYCGLSGALNGLLVLGLLEWRRRSGELLPLLILTGATGKLCFDLVSGINVFTDPAWRSVPAAHLVGMLAGVAWFAGERWRRHFAGPAATLREPRKKHRKNAAISRRALQLKCREIRSDAGGRL